jgi:hypothetical protein
MTAYFVRPMAGGTTSFAATATSRPADCRWTMLKRLCNWLERMSAASSI